MLEIDFFNADSGNCPVEVFLDSLTSRQAQKLMWVMKLVEDLEIVPKQYFKKLTNTNGIWEIRAQLGSNIFRVLGFFSNSTQFIVTNGFQKKSNKVPLNEIEMAEKRKESFLKRRIN